MTESAVLAIERTCRRHAECIAVESRAAPDLSFGELDALARGLASELEGRGVGPGDIVALDLEKSRQYVIGLLAVWYAGAGFLPLGPELPAARRRDMLAEAAPKVVLTRECIASGRPRSTWSRREVAPDDLAYVIYTSGSSGRPKGVRVAQRGLFALFATQCDVFRLGTGKRSLFQLSTLFDASVSDIGTALFSGATLVIEDPSGTRSVDGLLAAIEARRVTHADLPPSILPLIDPARIPACLETLVIGGEPADPGQVRALASRLRVVNVYGPTEATVCTSLCACDADWDRPLLGAPLPGVKYRVIDGELVIFGAAVALGYLKRPELERERFVMLGGERGYRTGDRVGELPGGELEFLGRNDRQIKLHGLRIELGEIESVLREHPAVREAAVLQSSGSLVACVTLLASATESELREHLALRLPRAFLPTRIEVRNELPRTPSEKTDYAKLGARSELATLVGTLLGLEHVDEDKSFSEQGGDSFRALELTVLAEALGLPISAERVLSPRPLCALLEERPVESRSAEWLTRAAEPDPALSRAIVAANESTRDPDLGRAILLTGATGALGSRLLEELSRTDREIWCLVRARDEAHGLDRVLRAAAVSRDRIRVVPADLRKPRFGLAEHLWQRLAGEVSCIVHAGALVNVALPYAALASTNVNGTLEAVRLAATGVPKALHHASTLSVFVSTDRARGHHLESDDLGRTREVYGGYSQSKWVAELLARRLRLRATYRLGLVVGGSRDDLLSRFLRGSTKIGSIPHSALSLSFDVTPVEYAARAIAEQVSLPVCEDTFHVCGESRTLEDLNQLLNLPVVTTETWLERARQLATDRDVAVAYLALCRVLPEVGAFSRHRGADLFETTFASFDHARFDERSRVPRPRIDLGRYVIEALELERAS